MRRDKLFDTARESYRVTRPKSLEAKIQSEKIMGPLLGTKETHNLVLEFNASDRHDVVKMLRDAADGIEALTS